MNNVICIRGNAQSEYPTLACYVDRQCNLIQHHIFVDTKWFIFRTLSCGECGFKMLTFRWAKFPHDSGIEFML